MRTTTAAAPAPTRRPRNNGQARRRHKAHSHPHQNRILPFAKSRLRPGEIGVVGFAGIGGWCTGWMEAVGVPPAIAVNHDDYAISVHKANHPECRHYPEDIFGVDIRGKVNGLPVGWAHFSPDCRDFSRAKGGKPISKKIRGLAWVVLKWAHQISPRIISIENVPEIQGWGPLIAKRDKATGRVIRRLEDGGEVVADPGERVPLRQQLLVRDPKRAGKYFRQWCAELRALGYELDFRTLRASDYGAATSRKRLFVMARRDGLPIRWPQPTHATPSDPRVIAGKLLPFKTAAECIDFSNIGRSIFDRKKPLALATQRRIAEGINRYVLKRHPFIVPYHAERRATETPRVHAVDAPLATQTTENRFAVATPVLMSNNSNNAPHAADAPLGTVTTGNRHFSVNPQLVNLTHGGRVEGIDEPARTITGAHRGEKALISPILAKTHSNGWDREAGGVTPTDEPSATLLAKDGLAVVSPVLIQTSYGEQEGQAPRVLDLHEPLGTVVAQGQKHSLVGAFLAKHNDGNASYGIPLDGPTDTITSKDHHALVSAGLAKLRGTSTTADAEEPAPTITGQGNHLGLVTAQITEYYGSDEHGAAIDSPLPTVTTKDRFALVVEFLERFIPGLHFPERVATVEIDGATYVIVDIFIRMLTPRELARCTGFPDDYVLLGTNTQQVGGVGNAVPPAFAKALASANLDDGEPEELAA